MVTFMDLIHQIDLENLNIIRNGVSEHIASSAKHYDRAGSRVLDIAPQDWAGASAIYQQATINTLDIDPTSDADFIADITQCNRELIADESFDVVIMTEVLEHTLNPFHAINEIHRILKKGGVLVMTTPFNFRIHGPLPDCWRFSIHGLQVLLNQFSSMDIQEQGSERFLCPVQYKTIAVK